MAAAAASRASEMFALTHWNAAPAPAAAPNSNPKRIFARTSRRDHPKNFCKFDASVSFCGSRSDLSASFRSRRPFESPQICFVKSQDKRLENFTPSESEEDIQEDLTLLDEEWDEDELDEMFDEFGKTIISNSSDDQISQDEADDLEARQFAIAAASAANDSKGGEITVLHVKSLVYWTRYFVIVTAFSRPQSEAIAKRITDVADEQFERKTTGGKSTPTNWTLLDYGDVIIHIFMPKERDYYNLEEFYGNATLVDLPFVTRGML